MAEKCKPTLKLYDSDAYASDFDATVLSCEPIMNVVHSAEREKDNSERGDSSTPTLYQVVLDQTVFFPEEGGQTPDRGVLMVGFTLVTQVTDVQIRNGLIYHTVDQAIDPGVRVHGIINFDYRFSNMQNHSGEHIFSGLVHKKYGYENVGFHLSDSIVTMDYNGKLDQKQVAELELLANDWIRRNVEIECRYPSAEELEKIDYRSKKEIDGDVRIVTIPGCDVCACCAPHVKTTSEIGILKVLSVTNYKGGVRLSILCGERAELDYIHKHKELEGISQTLKVPQLETVAAVGKLLDEKTKLQMALNQANERILQFQIDEIEDCENAFLFSSITDSNTIRRAVNDMAKKFSGYVGIFYNEDLSNGTGENTGEAASEVVRKYSYIIGSGTKKPNCKDLQARLHDDLQARGGGQPAMIQGSIRCTYQAIVKVINLLK